MIRLKEHNTLVARADRWLRNSAVILDDHRGVMASSKCPVVLTDFVSSSWEVPDAIGWCYGGRSSILIECKVSRGDFLADAKKPFRRHPQTGMGRFRYYMTPLGLLKVDELPVGWGLLETKGKRVSVLKLAEKQLEYQRTYEVAMLWSALRRCQLKQSAEHGRSI